MSPPEIERAAEFIRAAERDTNAYDLDGLTGAYAEDATLDVVLDGARETHHGRAEIHAAWAGYVAGMRRTGLQVSKHLLAAQDPVVTNAWSGRLRRGHDACGMELWRFDGAGRVVEHRMWSSFDVRDARTLRGRLRLLLAYPRIALSLLGTPPPRGPQS